MKTNNILFRMAARCEAAGRPNNEDNYQLDDNLSDNSWGFTADAEVSLGEKGALLVVCDGMGGMNAGEVASDIAVKTIKEWFTTDKLTDTAVANPCKYIASAIVAADAAIKAHSKANPDTDGMGSTIVMAWLLGQKVYVGWCGDSRCYRFNPQLGLERLSHDHSYVQELVDAGKLTDDLAFDHPNNNIITRSLGDPRGAAQPDTKEFDLYNNDIILLCSDGLCGTLRDHEIAEQVQAHQTSMQECRDALWTADEAAGWHDNVTIALAQIISGGKEANAATQTANPSNNMSASKAALITANKRLRFLLGGIALLIIITLLGGVSYKYRSKITTLLHNDKEVIQDSISSALNDTIQKESPSKIIEDKESKAPKGDAKPTKADKKPADSKKEFTKKDVNQQSDTVVPKVVKVNPIETLPKPATQVEDPKKQDSVPAVQKSEEISTVQEVDTDTLPMPTVKKETDVTQPTDTTNKTEE